jgi:nicotinic acid mononucleotide adenylyltransferase
MDYDYYIHPSFPISSTEVRKLIKQNKIISPYVTDLVNKYINIHNLYHE